MKTLLTLLLAALCATTSYGQTIKTLGYNTTNGNVVYAGTNRLTFTNAVALHTDNYSNSVTGTTVDLALALWDVANDEWALNGNDNEFQFNGTNRRDNFRIALGLGATWLTNTNVTNFRTAIGLGSTNNVVFQDLQLGTDLLFNGNTGTISWSSNNYISLEDGRIGAGVPSTTNDVFVWGPTEVMFRRGINFTNGSESITRTNLGLGATNSVTFHRVVAGATNVPQNAFGNIVAQNGSGEEFHISSGGFTFYEGTNTGGSLEAEGRIFSGGVWTFENGASTRGNIVITNQTATNNGLLFIYRTNNEPFLGLANLLASNNTTISNETLFRVGVAEATNKAAQFGFRSTNTNGNGVAVFSVFGFDALMMIGADASTNAVIYSGGGTNNEVMTLIRDGATEFARPIRFSTNASTRPETNAPANTTNVAAWVEIRIGTNSYRAPLYQ